ncbi:vacuolar protein sorting-associated protein 13, partial [Aureobasidium melanogenum]
EEQRKELYDAIDFDEKKQIADAVDMPKEAIKLQVDMSLQEGSFTLKRDPHGKATEMLQLVFQGFDTKFLQRTDSMLAEVSLETMKLFDGTTEGNLFPQMLNIKNSIPDDKRIEEVKDDDAAAGDEEDEPPLDPFFALTFENNPLDGHADTDLTVKLKAMEFVYNPKFVVEVANFFKPPERHMESIGALMESASATVEGLRQQTRAGLEYALQEHKTIDAKLDLQAPLIIIPDSVTKKESLCMILDAGYISVRSELIDKDTLNEVQSKQKQQYTDEDYKRLEQLMYDKFLVKLQSTQLLLGPSIEETKKQLDENNTSRHLHVVDRINIDFTVETCIVPKAPGLTKFRIGGHLPVLHASISDSKYKSLMKLIDVAIPKFGTDEDSTKKPAQAVQKQAQRPRQKSIVDTDVTGRSRSKSFQFSAQEHELVMEEETDNEDEEFKDAKQTTKEPTKDINQRNFEFKFKVDKLQGSLYRSDPDGKKQDQLLVDLIAENFDLLFYQRPFDMVAEVSLRTLAVEDHVEENPFPEFKNLISSEDQDTNEQQNLFSLKFIKVNPEHPDFMSTYEGIATNLDVSVSTINLLVTRKTLLTLLDFVMITFTNPGEPQANQSQSIES